MRNSRKENSTISAVRKLMQELGVTPESLLENSSDSTNKFLSIKQAEEYACVSRWTLRRAIQTGGLEASKMNDARSGKILISVQNLKNWINSHRIKVCRKKN